MTTPFRVDQTRTKHSGKPLSDHAKCWKNNEETGFLDPVWPRDPPDWNAVLTVAKDYLPKGFEADVRDKRTSQGAFHKLYFIPSLLSQTQPWGHLVSRSYLMRVAIPVEPFYKTESDVATMEYVRKYTHIPIPGVVAWSSSAESTALGFEWILMESIDGVTLESVWEKMNFEDKKLLTQHVAYFMRQLLDLRFTLLGNIYFVDKWNEVNYPSLSSWQPLPLELSSKNPKTDINIGKDGNFVIGRMVSTRFFRDKSAVLPAKRGPYFTAKKLAVAETKLLGQRIRHLSHKPGTDYYCDVDQELNRDNAEMLDVFNKLEEVPTNIFSDSDEPEDRKVLWHGDLSSLNILVDPKTFKLESIVDWESVSIVPAWEVNNGIPTFLQGSEVDEPPPPGNRSEEDEDRLVEIRRDWELGRLRKVYTDIVGPLFETNLELENRCRLKMELSACLITFEDVWKRTRSWLDCTIAAEGFELL
jgi:aminoglycoside phosphotransferase